ncbi:MAG: amidase domain-containing protein [Anaerolineaceae bacterium]|nr:amidase domain-containing protein [Anaerolineaceae bacterium]
MGTLLVVTIAVPQTIVYAAYFVQDSASAGLVYSGAWGTTTDVPALFGSVQHTSTAGAWVSWQFNGNRVAYLYSMAFNRGSVTVQIDDIVVDRLDASVNHFTGTEIRRQVGKVYSGFGSGTHTIKIINGPAGANGRRYIDLDAFVSDIMSFSQGNYNDDASIWVDGIHYHPLGTHGNGWTSVADPNAYQGSYKVTNVSRSGFRINFYGDSIRWYFPRRNDLGKIAVTIDGEDHGILDPNLESGITSYYWSGLGDGIHLMTVTNTGLTSSSGTVLALDWFQVGGSTYYDRITSSGYADGWAHSRNTFWYGDYPDNDCANFASQAQHKGGFAMHPAEDWLKDISDVTQWWNNFPYDRFVSYTWKIVDRFLNYASQRPEYEVRDNDGYTRRGDLILMDIDDDGFVDHMKTIVGNGYISPYSSDYQNIQPPEIDQSSTLRYTLMTSAHTQDRWHVPLCFNYNCTTHSTVFIRVIP